MNIIDELSPGETRKNFTKTLLNHFRKHCFPGFATSNISMFGKHFCIRLLEFRSGETRKNIVLKHFKNNVFLISPPAKTYSKHCKCSRIECFSLGGETFSNVLVWYHIKSNQTWQTPALSSYRKFGGKSCRILRKGEKIVSGLKKERRKDVLII